MAEVAVAYMFFLYMLMCVVRYVSELDRDGKLILSVSYPIPNNGEHDDHGLGVETARIGDGHRRVPYKQLLTL